MATTDMIPVSEFRNFYDSFFGDITKAVTDFMDNVSKGLIPESERYQRLADEYFNNFQKYSARATEYANAAGSTGNTTASTIWNRYASEFADVASQRNALGNEAWLKGLASGLGGELGKFLGPVGAAIDGVAMLDAIVIGDYSALGEISSGVLAGTAATAYVGWQGAVALAAFLGFSGPILAPALILTGIGIGAALLGELLWNKFGSQIRTYQ